MFFYDFPIIGHEGTLPLFLVSVGLNEWQYHVFCKNGDQYTKFLYCTKGSGVLIVNDVKYNIEPYTAFVIPAGVPHEYYTIGDSWDTHWVIPSGFACNEMLNKLGFDVFSIFGLDDIKYLDHVFRKMHEAIISDKMFGNMRASGIMYDFLIELYRICTAASKTNFTNTLVAKAIDYIEIHYTENIGLDELCGCTGVSKQHLCKLFRETLSSRPMEYIAKRRIKQAKILLSQTDISIESIAEQTGFCDSSYFCKLFKRYEGITPSQFRKY